MKRGLKRLLAASWRATCPLRRPIAARLASFVTACMAKALERTHAAHAPADDVNLVLDSILSEIHRLQLQVEELRSAVEDHGAASRPTSLYEADAA